MPAVVTEHFDSRNISTNESGTNNQAKLKYFIQDTNDDVEAWQALFAASPNIYEGLIRRTVDIRPMGPTLWDGQVTYVDPDTFDAQVQKVPTGDFVFQFDVTGESERKYYSDRPGGGLIAFIPGTATHAFKDFDGAIQWDGDQAQGTDVVVPKLQFSLQYRQPRAFVTLAYIESLRALVGGVNNATWKGFPAKTVQFMGAVGQQGTETDPQIEYRFRCAPKVGELEIGGITIPDGQVDPFDYVWVWYEARADNLTKQKTAYAHTAFVHKDIVEEVDFAAIGIGT